MNMNFPAWFYILLSVIFFALAIWGARNKPWMLAKRFALGRWLINGTGFSVVKIVMCGDSMYLQDVKGTLHKIGRR